MNGPVPVLVIFGPTAVGKTAVAGRLFGPGGLLAGKAEIVSADSMQVYRGMDIGTAKPDPSFLTDLPHHLIDIKNPDEQFGVGELFPRRIRPAPIVIPRDYRHARRNRVLYPELLLGMPKLRPPGRRSGRNKGEDGGGRRCRSLWTNYGPSIRQAQAGFMFTMSIALSVPLKFMLFRADRSVPLPCQDPSEAATASKPWFFTVSGKNCMRIEQRVAAMFRDGLAGEFRSLLEQGYGKMIRACRRSVTGSFQF